MCAAMALVMALSSCSKEDGGGVADTLIRFSAGLNPVTMAPIESDVNGLVTSGALSDIQILRGAEGTTPLFNRLPQGSSSGVPTTTASLDGTGIMVTADQMRYNEDGTAANFMAYYPKNSTVGGAYTAGVTDADPAHIEWTIDGMTDLIAAERVSKSYTASGNNIVQLHFKHLLARLRLRCVCVDDANGALYQGITEAKITVPNKVYAEINADGTIEPLQYTSVALADRVELDFGACEMSQKGEYAKKDLMICPKGDGTILDNSLYLKFAGFPDDAAKGYLLTNLKLVAGKTTTITVTVSGAEPLTISTTIEAWNAVDTGQGWVTE